MKKSLLFVLAVVLSGSVTSQVIFSGESPASVQGSYDLTFAEPSGGWGVPDLLDPANAVLDTLVQFFDGSAGDSLGCTAAVNAASLDGQIAILYRGDCQFGTKALNAQNAGAIACVIINNVLGAPVGMAPGNDGASVTIPVVMIGLSDGNDLIAEMQNGPVEVFIGNKTGFYPNDVGTVPARILRAEQYVTPALIAQNATEFGVEMGAWVYNYGFQNQTNVTLGATVDFQGSNIYNEINATPVNIAAGDSAFFALPTFSQATYDVGLYEVQYSVLSDSIDDYSFDNSLRADFVISDSLYGHASLDAFTLLPNTSGGFRPSNSTTYSSCIHFRDPNASRIAPEAITFTAVKGANAADPSLEGEPVLISVQEYNDQFTDINDPNYVNPIGSINEIASTEYFFPADLPGTPVTADFDQPVPLQDGQRYLFCVTTFNPDLFFGHDPSMDYVLNQNNYLQPLFPIQSDNGWNPNGFGADVVPGVTVHMIDAAFLNLKNEKLAIEMSVYPSPSSNVMNVDFKGHEVNKLELLNLTGQTVIAQSVESGVAKTKLDVNGIENGVYIVKVYLTNGMTQTMQVVVSH
ncbi:MAG: PA domain-containing protein [Brumimicrobium sp.]|nr:PA domain-containing protein [Brumimicrobium sp.]